MRELLVTSVELVGYLIGTAVLAVAGLLAEWSSLSYLSAGNTLFGAWLVVIGALTLYAAFSLGTDRLLPCIREATN